MVQTASWLVVHMLEVIQVIALLCHVGVEDSSYLLYSERRQLECQKYYVRCVNDRPRLREGAEDAVQRCLLDREVSK